MKQLQKEFIGRGQVKGFRFTQLKKSNYSYIYKINTGSSEHFEVFLHIENRQFNCISYPQSNSFGIWAWTFATYELAINKMEEIDLRKEVSNG